MMLAQNNDVLNVMHVGNFNAVRARPKHGYPAFYSMDYKISKAVVKLGHNELSFDERSHQALQPKLFRSKQGSSTKIRNELCRWIDLHQSDILLLGHAQSLTNKDLLEIKQRYPSLKIIGWWVDTVNPAHQLFTVEKQNMLRERIAIVDAFYVTTSPKAMSQHLALTTVNHLHFLPNMCDESIEKFQSFKAEKHAADIFYAASLHANRKHFEAQLKQLNVTKKLYIEGNKILGQAFLNTMAQCKAGINISSILAPLYSSDRMIQIAGNGLLLVSQYFDGCEQIFSQEQAIYFENPAELVDKIKVLETEHWREMAEKSWHRAHSEYSAVTVVQKMLACQPIASRFQ